MGAKAYTGIGSRETPEEILVLFENLAYKLAVAGWTLRSGAAPGADSAFERGAWRAVDEGASAVEPELYLPWPRFENRERIGRRGRERPQAPEAFEIAATHHPAWPRLSRGARALHARNCHQVLGHDVTKPRLSTFVVCWTKGGSGKGGTGQAIRLAQSYGVEVIDAGAPEGLARVSSFLD